MTTRNGDLHTVLRHLVGNTQWGGNQGEKAETMEALDRLTDDNYDADADADNKDTEPDVSGGSVPSDLTASGAAKKTTGARTPK